VLIDQSFECCPPHPLRLSAEIIEDPALPTQLLANSIRFPNRTVSRILPRARIGKLMTMSAGEDAPTVQDCHTPSASTRRAKEPRPRATQMASRPLDLNRILLVHPYFAVRAVSVFQGYLSELSPDVDRPNGFATLYPTPRPDSTRPQHALTRK